MARGGANTLTLSRSCFLLLHSMSSQLLLLCASHGWGRGSCPASGGHGKGEAHKGHGEGVGVWKWRGLVVSHLDLVQIMLSIITLNHTRFISSFSFYCFMHRILLQLSLLLSLSLCKHVSD